METVIKVKGITRRWLVNILFSIIAGVLIVLVALGFLMYSYYCNMARSQADNYARYFTGLSYSTADNFIASVREYIEKFEHSEKNAGADN